EASSLDRGAWMESGKRFSAYAGLYTQDYAIQHTMGPIPARTREHLASEDMVVVQFRRYLLETLAAFQRGVEPLPGLQDGMRYEDIDHRTTVVHCDTPAEEVFRRRDWVGVVSA